MSKRRYTYVREGQAELEGVNEARAVRNGQFAICPDCAAAIPLTFEAEVVHDDFHDTGMLIGSSPYARNPTGFPST